MKTIAVDFDGVIHDYRLGWHDGTIYGNMTEDCLRGLTDLMSQYYVCIFTTRDTVQVATWLKQRGFKVIASNDIIFWDIPNTLLVTNMKPAAVAYIDDRAYKFTDWKDVINEFVSPL